MATDLSQSNFNVRQFKKAQAQKPIRLATHYKTASGMLYPRDRNKQKSEPNFYSSTPKAINKIFRYNESFIPPHTRSTTEPKTFFKKGRPLSTQPHLGRWTTRIGSPLLRRRAVATGRP